MRDDTGPRPQRTYTDTETRAWYYYKEDGIYDFRNGQPLYIFPATDEESENEEESESTSDDDNNPGPSPRRLRPRP